MSTPAELRAAIKKAHRDVEGEEWDMYDEELDAILDAVIASINELPTYLTQLYDTSDTVMNTKDVMALLQQAKSANKESE